MTKADIKDELQGIVKDMNAATKAVRKRTDYLETNVVQDVQLNDELARFEAARDRVSALADSIGEDAPAPAAKEEVKADPKPADKK
jgi:hypothetical protein